MPTLTAVASPSEPAALLTAAMLRALEAQVTEAVRSCVVASVYVPVAGNCCVVPRASDGVVGVTAMDTSCAAVTVSAVEPVMAPLVAERVAVPMVTAVASPLLPAALLTAATGVALEAQVTGGGQSCVVASVYVPVAVSCRVVPRASDGAVGVTAMETSCAAVTVSTVEPVMPERVAERVAVPVLAAVASPLLPAALLTVATVVALEAQVTGGGQVLRGRVRVGAGGGELLGGAARERRAAGVTVMEVSCAAVTVSAVEPVTPERAARGWRCRC